MVHRLFSLMRLTTSALVVPIVAACAAPAATPTATPKAAAPTLVWEGGKLQPLPDGWPRKAIVFQASEPGGSDDLYFRALAKVVEPLGATLAVNNHGASEQMAPYMLSQPHDGYNLMAIGLTDMSRLQTQKLTYSVKDLKPIITTDTKPFAFSVPTDSPSKSLKDVVDLAKANPGKVRVSIGSPGSITHIGAADLGIKAGVEWVILPNDSSGAAMLTMIGGGAEAALATGSATAKEVKAGKARALAVLGSTQSPLFPGIPTFKQAGYEVAFDQFQTLVAPAGVPDERVEWLHELIKKAIESPEYQKVRQDQGLEPLYLSPKDTAKMLGEVDTALKAVLERLGLLQK